jgi:small-conductance mechanosensitive channel
MGLLSRISEIVPDPVLRRAFEAAVIVAAAWLAYALLSFLLGRAAGMLAGSASDERRRRINSVFLVVESVAKGAVIFFAALFVFKRLGLEPQKSSRVLGTLVIAWVVYMVLGRVIRAAAAAAETRVGKEEQKQRVTTLILLGDSVVKYVIILVAGLTVLRQVGVDVTPVLAGAGVAGLAVGFGAQNLVRDVIAGFFIIMEAQYAVGDLVEINGVFGQVEGVGLRVTRLRQPNGQLRHFSNGSISSADTYTADYVAYVITVPVPREEPAEPIPVVRSAFEDFDREFRALAEKPTFEVEDLPSYSRVVRVRARAIPGRHAALEQKLPTRLAAALERAGHPLPKGTDVAVSLRFPPPGGSG